MKVSPFGLLPPSWKAISVTLIFFALSANVLVIFGQYPVCNSFTSQTERNLKYTSSLIHTEISGVGVPYEMEEDARLEV